MLRNPAVPPSNTACGKPAMAFHLPFNGTSNPVARLAKIGSNSLPDEPWTDQVSNCNAHRARAQRRIPSRSISAL